MSSRVESGIAVTLRTETEREHFRLLELPPALLTLLTSENPPILQLKSKEETSTAGGEAVKDAYVVLCTADQTFNLRQVSTSNSVFITRCTATGVEAVAKCDSSMEVISTKGLSAEPYLRAMLPVYTSTGSYSSTHDSVSKKTLFSHIPLSQAECEVAWSQLACFESTDPPGCFIPSAKVQIRIWENFISIATAASLDLTGRLSKADLLAILDELRGEGPSELLSQIITNVSTRQPDESFLLDEDRFIQAVGLSCLSARSDGKPTATSSWLSAWKELVPEAWRSKCQATALPQATYHLQHGGKDIVFVDSSQSAAGAGSSQASSGQQSLGAKRKWHEKFRPSKTN